MGKKRFFKRRNLFLISFLAVAGIFSAGAFAVNVNFNRNTEVEKAEAGSNSFKLVGKISSLNLNSFSYASGKAMTNGGDDNKAYYKNVLLTAGDVFKATDNTSWLGYANKDSTWIGDDKFYYAAQANKIWTGTNLYWNSDGKKCTGSWGTYGTDSYVDGGTGQITVRMKTPQYDYSGTYWTSSGATTWIRGTKNYQETAWSSESAKIDTSGNVQTWEFSFSLSDYTDFLFERCGTSYTEWADWGAGTNWFNCDTIFCSDKNFYVRETGYYDIYVNNSNKVYIGYANHSVTLNQQSGSGGTTNVTAVYSQPMPTEGVVMPTRTGYTFGGYYTGTSGSGKQYYTSAGESANNWAETGNTTLYAKWTGKNYSVSYTLNGGSHGTTHPTSGTFGTAFYVSAPSKTGFTFKGWTVTAGLNSTYAKWGTTSSPTTTISNSSTLCVNGATGNVYFLNINANSTAVTLTANWDPNQYTYTTGTLPTGVSSLTCTRYSSPNKHAATGTIASDDPVYYGDTLYWTATASTGYTITTLNYSSTSDLYTVGTSGDISGVAVTSVAASGNLYTVTLDQQSGSGGTSSVTATFGSAMPSGKTAPSRTGYIFGGYYGSTGGSGTQYYNASMASTHVWDVASSTSIYAKWTAKTCKLVFDLDYGSGPAPTNLSATYGQAMPNYTSAAPWRNPGYTFGGYYTEKNGGGTCYYTSELQSANIWAVDTTSDTTLYAYWIAKTTTVTFDKNGGEGGSDGFTATYDAAVPDITAPTKTGYTFQGYYTEGGYQVYTSTGKGGKIWGDDSAEVTLYARWTAIKYDVSITAGSGISSAYLSSDTSGSPTATSFDYGSTVYGFVVLQGGYAHASASWALVSGTADTQGAVYRVGSLTVSTSGNDFGTIDALSGESAAITFATNFNTRVGGICVYAGGTNFSNLKTEWNGTQQTAYNNLEGYQKYWLDKDHASSDDNVQNMFAMYDYIAHKYETGSGDDKLHDFLNRNNGAQAAAVNNFSPFDYFTNDENNLSTLIIVIASAVSLLSITALSVLMVKKRKRKEQ